MLVVIKIGCRADFPFSYKWKLNWSAIIYGLTQRPPCSARNVTSFQELLSSNTGGITEKFLGFKENPAAHDVRDQK